MSGKGYEELIILNRKLDELLNKYDALKNELTELVREIDNCIALLDR